MKKVIFAYFVIINIAFPLIIQAQEKTVVADTSDMKIVVTKPRRFYMGNGFDLFMLSASNLQKPGEKDKITTPRFTAIVNIGWNLHYDINKHLGLFTGISIKNLGLIDKTAGVTTKYRVYTVGLPLGIKIGDLRNRNFVLAGGGIDIPFNYRVKTFTDRFHKISKSNEWFGNQTATIMPYVFLGVSFDPGVIVKAQYYPGNFFNEDYVNAASVKPFAGMKANIFALSLSLDIHYNQYKIQEREYRKWKMGKSK